MNGQLFSRAIAEGSMCCSGPRRVGGGAELVAVQGADDVSFCRSPASDPRFQPSPRRHVPSVHRRCPAPSIHANVMFHDIGNTVAQYSSTRINVRPPQNLNTCSAVSPASIRAPLRTTDLILCVPELLQNTAQCTLLHTIFLPCQSRYLPRRTYTVARRVRAPRLTTLDAHIPQMNTLTFSAKLAGPMCC